jgi:hypothetical protein
MKAKDLIKFLEKVDPETDLIMSINGHYHVPIAVIQQAYLNPQTKKTWPHKTDNFTEPGLYFFGPDIACEGELEEDEIILIDYNLLKE